MTYIDVEVKPEECAPHNIEKAENVETGGYVNENGRTEKEDNEVVTTEQPKKKKDSDEFNPEEDIKTAEDDSWDESEDVNCCNQCINYLVCIMLIPEHIVTHFVSYSFLCDLGAMRCAAETIAGSCEACSGCGPCAQKHI